MIALTVLRLAALVSGSGSNLQSIINAIATGSLDAKIVRVVASRAGIKAEQRALQYNLPYTLIQRRQYMDNSDLFCDSIAAELEPLDIDLILLCGFLSFLSEKFVKTYEGRIMNIHPSLLPAFGGKGAYGMHVHKAVLAYGVKISGCSVMFVDNGEDTGPIILQRTVPVLDDDTPDTLAARVMQQEDIAYPEAVRLFAEGRLSIVNRKVLIRKD